MSLGNATAKSTKSTTKSTIHARKQKSLVKCHAMPHPGTPDDGRLQPPNVMQKPVLVLNASYEPINICGARRALVLVLKGVAKTEEEHGAVLHAARVRVPMPSVIRLLEYRRIPHQTRALSRKTSRSCASSAAHRSTPRRSAPRLGSISRRCTRKLRGTSIFR